MFPINKTSLVKQTKGQLKSIFRFVKRIDALRQLCYKYRGALF